MRKFAVPGIFMGFFFLSCLSLKAQQGNQWFFGRFAGLNFGSNPPSPQPGGQLSSLEGSSSICDDNGNLLFYTNGVLVYNRIHDLMPNGSIRGHVSSFQNSVIVPMPGNKNIYYLFTTDAIENNGQNGYNYSIIDMTKDNGLGDVVTKNIFLSGPSSERITSIRGADYKSYWVITNDWNSNIFRTYKIDCTGLDPNPVISTAGRVLNQNPYSNIGVLRVSGNGKMLVQTNAKGRPSDNPTDEFFQIFDFDNATGQITNGRDIPLSNDGYYWGGEFSPNSGMLYLVNPFSKSIHQFDVGSNNPTAILSSKQVLPVGDASLAGILMGPDLKLYIASGGHDYLHVINNPDNVGTACNLVLKQQPLGSGTSQLGLPNESPSFFVNRAADFTFQSSGGCNGLIQFTGIWNVSNLTIQWDFGDGQNSTALNPIHQFADINKTYTVKLTVKDASNCLNETIAKPVIPAGGNLKVGFNSTIVCDQLEASFHDETQSTSSSLVYTWDFGDGNTSADPNPVHQYSSVGIFIVKLVVTVATGCMNDSSSRVINFNPPVIDAGSDLQVSSNPVQLQASGGVRYHWTPSLYLSDPDIANPTMSAKDDITYVVTGYDDKECFSSDTLKITVLKNLLVEVPNAFTPGSPRNGSLRPLLRLIDHINYFRVYNRWGQLVFETKEIGKGWDGKLNGQLQPTGTYTWMIEVVDFNNNVIAKKGSSILVR
jgi:gliding motility-associated-like protein